MPAPITSNTKYPGIPPLKILGPDGFWLGIGYQVLNAATLGTFLAAFVYTADPANPYEDAYEKLAPAAAARLAQLVGGMDSPMAMCHSLGTRTALLAMKMGARFGRVVMFNGAMLQRDCAGISLPPTLNLICKTDAVLNDLGDRFGGEVGACIGIAGLPGATNVVIDDAETQQRALDRRGWAIQGSDHWNVYGWRGNAPMIRAWLAGDDLNDLLEDVGERRAA